jgi:uncharacterized protein with von Willebrand factor type A (vWA) domain
LDKWSKRLGKEIMAQPDHMLAAALAGRDDANYEAADFHAACFEPAPALADKCMDDRRQRFMAEMLQSPEYQVLHAETMLSEVASELASANLAAGYLEYVQKEDDRKEPERPRGEGGGDGECAGGAGDEGEGGKSGDGATAGGHGAADGDGTGKDAKAACRAAAAAARAIAAAAEDVGELKEAEEVLGMPSMGGTGGDDHGRMSAAEVKATLTRIHNSRTLKRICELAGRYLRVAQGRQRSKTNHGPDDMVGIELGGDVTRMLASELAYLAHPDLQPLGLLRMIERTALCTEWREVEKIGKGPIVVTIDESGSMYGEPVENAKAIALALAWIAERQNRWCCLIAYSGYCEPRLLILKPRQPRDVAALMDWLEHFYGGGSDLDVPLDHLPRLWGEIRPPEGKTDIISITDGCLDIPDTVFREYMAFKDAHQVRQHSLIVGSWALRFAEADMAKVSDEIYAIPSLTTGDEAVGTVLSI